MDYLIFQDVQLRTDGLPFTFSLYCFMNTALTGSWIKRNIIAVIVIALLVGALGVLGLQVGKIKSENTKLQEDLASTKQKYDSMSASYYSTKKAESVLIDDYLDEAVVVRVGDDKYYHRLNCPTFPNSYSYHFLIPLAAQSEGYSKCTKCFDVPAKQYISNNF